MNLGEIRNEIENELRWAPSATAHATDLTRVINRVYQELCASHRWLFLEALVDFDVFADVTVVVDSTINNYQVDINMTPSRDWIGHELIGPNNLKSTINAVDGQYLYLEDPIGAGGALTGQTCTVSFKRYIMPAECIEVLGLMSRVDDRGEVFLMDRSAERELMLNDDETGKPTSFLLEPAPMIRAPYATPTIALGAGVGNVPAGTYRYCYTYAYAGLESGRSGISNTLTVAAPDDVVISNLENGFTGQGHGFNIYREDGSGVFRLVAVLNTGATTYTDTNVLPATNQYLTLEDNGPRTTFRLWPRPDADSTLQVRYIRRPTRLAHDTHVPVLPPEFHGLLVHLALVELGQRFGADAFVRLHQKRVEQKLSLMRRRYLQQGAQYRTRQPYQTGWSTPNNRPKVTLV